MKKRQSKLLSSAAPKAGEEFIDLLISIWESSTEYFIIAEDLNGNITAWNEGAKRFYGYSEDEVIGKSAFMLHDPIDVESGKAQAILNAVSKNGKWTGEVNRKRKNGERFTAFVTVTKRYDRNHHPSGFTMISRDLESIRPLKDSQTNLKISQDKLSISEDVNVQLVEHIKTQNKKLITVNNELVKQNYRSQEANRLKSEFLANMSHELRTPLNAIIGFSNLIDSGRTGAILPKQKEYIGDILSSARHLLQLINDVLDLSKVEAGKMEFQTETFNVKNIINEVCSILKGLIVSSRIRLEIDIDPQLDTVTLDPAKFKQVLYNFLSNAIKFTPEKGKVIIRAFLQGNNEFRLEIEDTGIGIRSEDIEKLFIEFQQLDCSASKKYPGTGLGLALSRRIVEAQGGKVGVRSVFGKGSCFFAILPKGNTAQQKKKAPVGKKASSKKIALENISAQTILVIEDDPEDCNDIKKIMSDAGYSVTIATNGAEAIKLFQTHYFSAITLDLILPDMSGFDILRVLRSGGPNQNVPVIVTSVVAEKSASIGYHIHDFLVKPVTPEELLTSLKKAGVFSNQKNLVLLIDNDPNSSKLLKQTLTEAGYQIIAKPDRKSGLIALKEDFPNIIILDLLMPDLDGFEFLQELKQMPNRYNIPVIIWTNKDLTNEEKAMLKSSCSALVHKGDGPGNLLSEIARIKAQQHIDKKAI